MRREGSPFTGLSTIALKEAADHLTSARMHLVMLLVLLTALGLPAPGSARLSLGGRRLTLLPAPPHACA